MYWYHHGGRGTGDHSVAEPTLQQRANYVATLEADQQEAIRNLQETQETINSVAAALSTTDKEIVAETSEASSPLRTQIETQIETLEEDARGTVTILPRHRAGSQSP